MTTQDDTTTTTPRGSRRKAWSLFGAVAVVVIGIDLAVKEWTTSVIAHGEPVKLLGGLIYVIYARNSGAAFSMFSDLTWVFPIIASGVIAWLLVMLRSTVSVPWAVALGLVLGGAAGNLGDRIFRAPKPFHGHVVDMFSFLDDHAGHFPVFNIADSALTVGVALAILLEFMGRRRDGTSAKDEAAKDEAKGEQAGSEPLAETSGAPVPDRDKATDDA
ncbi:signal peptidase II [Dactylosporangium sp. NPDC049742]|uniref:signal peptidase II n=1 Tax=Dactylosporangium sp. NPDC049742 TaxID=3154737 RepID=UPI0034375112